MSHGLLPEQNLVYEPEFLEAGPFGHSQRLSLCPHVPCTLFYRLAIIRGDYRFRSHCGLNAAESSSLVPATSLGIRLTRYAPVRMLWR
jgi:hypothetical protein